MSLQGIGVWAVGLVTDAFTTVFTAVNTILVATPDVTTLPAVRTVTARTTMVLDAVFVLVFLCAGVMTMVAGGDEKTRYTAKHLMPRIVTGFVVAHFSPLLCSQLITLTDAASAALSGGKPSRLAAFTAVRTQIGAGAGTMSVLLFVILVLVTTVLFAAAGVSFLGRLGLLVIIAVTGPLALACHALPQLEGAARLWWRSLIGCLLIPLLQVLALQSGEQVLLDPRAQAVVFTHHGGTVLNLLVVITLLWTAVKIPGLVRRTFIRTTGSGLGPQVLRVVAMQRGLRALTGSGRRRRAGARS